VTQAAQRELSASHPRGKNRRGALVAIVSKISWPPCLVIFSRRFLHVAWRVCYRQSPLRAKAAQ